MRLSVTHYYSNGWKQVSTNGCGVYSFPEIDLSYYYKPIRSLYRLI